MKRTELVEKLQDKLAYKEKLTTELVAVSGQIVMLRDMVKEIDEKAFTDKQQEIKDKKKPKKRVTKKNK